MHRAALSLLFFAILLPESAAQDAPSHHPTLVERHRVRVPGAEATALAFGSEHLWVGSSSGELIAWNRETHKVDRRRDVTYGGRVHDVAISPSEDRVAILGDAVRVFDTETLRLERVGPDTAIYEIYVGCQQIAFLDEAHVAAIVSPELLAVLALPQGNEVARFSLPRQRIAGLATCDGESLDLTIEAEAPRTWSWRTDHTATFDLPWGAGFAHLRDGTLVHATWRSPKLMIGEHVLRSRNSVTCLRSAENVISVQRHAPEVEFYDVHANVLASVRHPHEEPRAEYLHALSNDGRWIATGGSGGLVAVWEGERLVATFRELSATARSLGFSGDGEQLAFVAAGTAHACDLASGHLHELEDVGCVTNGFEAHAFTTSAGDALGYHTPFVVQRDAEARGRFGARLLARSPDGERVVFERAQVVFEQIGDETPRLLWKFRHANDIAWARDGSGRWAIALETQHGIGRFGFLHLVERDGSSRELRTSRPRRLTESCLSCDISPSGKHLRVATAERVVVYDIEDSPPELVDERAVHLEWLRHLDEDTLLAHDGRFLSLRDARTLDVLWQEDPTRSRVRVGEENQRQPIDVLGGTRPYGDTIHGARLSNDLRRLAVATDREVVVYDLRR
ncbi:MAG: hypothetical protein H6833_07210 [Planctomycetes bacterium]|nr:hypothetical protein [Planctomycetota bacterium]